MSVAVMAHPSRRPMVDELTLRLDRPAAVAWDERGVEWDTGRRALLAHDPNATHHLVVQDDAVVCRDLVAGVEQALRHVPEQTPLCLYFGRHTPFPHHTRALAARATTEGVSWLAIGGLHWGVAVVIPVPLIEPLVADADRRWRHTAAYDQLISRFLERRSITTWYPWPSFVDHRDTPSLFPRHGPGRVAHRFIGADVSTLDVDWSGPVLHVRSMRNYAATHETYVDHRRPQEDLMPKPEGAPHDELMTPRKTVTIRTDRRRHKVVVGLTVAHRDSWIVRHKPQLWRPLTIDYPADDVDVGDEQHADLVSNHEFEASATGPAGNCWCGRPEGDEIHVQLATGGFVPPPFSAPPPLGPVYPDALASSILGTAGGQPEPDPPEPPAAEEPDETPVEAPKPTAKAVRAWAKREGIEVPARGPLPDDVVARYVAAHERTDW